MTRKRDRESPRITRRGSTICRRPARWRLRFCLTRSRVKGCSIFAPRRAENPRSWRGKMQGRGLLVCNEINSKRAKILASNIERLGIANALVLNEHPQRLESRFNGYFDKILVDAPCSGEGMFRKEEAAVTDWSEETVFMCARRQAEILHSASVMLRPGGRLVYSTCTFSPEENEGSVSEFLKTHPDFSIEAVDAPWFSPGRPDWIECPAPGLEKTFRLWPHRLLGEGTTAQSCAKAETARARSSHWNLPQSFQKSWRISAGKRARPYRRESPSYLARRSISRRTSFQVSRDCTSCARVWSSARCARTGWNPRTRGRCGKKPPECRVVRGVERGDPPLSRGGRSAVRDEGLDAGAGRWP